MKKIALISIALLFAFHFSPFTSVSAQDVPQGFTYQAVVRNAQGAPVANSQVSVRIALLQGSALGSERYAELHTPSAQSIQSSIMQLTKAVPCPTTTAATTTPSAPPSS